MVWRRRFYADRQFCFGFVGPLGLGREDEGPLTIRHSRLDASSGGVGLVLVLVLVLVGKEKKKFSNSRRELGELDALYWTTLGTALDAGERSGPRWTGDAWLARRRRYSTARRDRVID
jgi:hypothetical protein